MLKTLTIKDANIIGFTVFWLISQIGAQRIMHGFLVDGHILYEGGFCNLGNACKGVIKSKTVTQCITLYARKTSVLTTS